MENINDYLGVYEIGVNYYAGTGRQTAEVQVGVDDDSYIRNFSKTLSSERGSAGNNSPIPVAEVEIRLIGGELVYDIYRK